MQTIQNTALADLSLFEARAQVLRALAHPARLRIMAALAEGERCVCELQDLVGSSLPTVSRHLSQMKAVGILACRRQGTQVYYRLLVPCLLPALDCVDRALRADSERRVACCSRPDEQGGEPCCDA
ncbi:MAG: winged helix-turn-helix transcriptional regulator [candidate division WS1 bacterium]|jgi:DNA-binding transcriptional ArsR family regulator|nr:winged helix-turn-helix transcriptional regulator [candidate division WS1 bacterium]